MTPDPLKQFPELRKYMKWVIFGIVAMVVIILAAAWLGTKFNL